ncbi:hypothetical protein A4X06_0g8089 [Tilletia controversa]|uniref:Uncharacterized protein n=1 Tax=Tilletia controversa TaxID=13291 RepID=A0A8X7MLQ7_9BASI|nr:hypothetical protein A4X06_0g8089 [Tilletia controversa]
MVSSVFLARALAAAATLVSLAAAYPGVDPVNNRRGGHKYSSYNGTLSSRGTIPFTAPVTAGKACTTSTDCGVDAPTCEFPFLFQPAPYNQPQRICMLSPIYNTCSADSECTTNNCASYGRCSPDDGGCTADYCPQIPTNMIRCKYDTDCNDVGRCGTSRDVRTDGTSLQGRCLIAGNSPCTDNADCQNGNCRQNFGFCALDEIFGLPAPSQYTCGGKLQQRSLRYMAATELLDGTFAQSTQNVRVASALTLMVMASSDAAPVQMSVQPARRASNAIQVAAPMRTARPLAPPVGSNLSVDRAKRQVPVAPASAATMANAKRRTWLVGATTTRTVCRKTAMTVNVHQSLYDHNGDIDADQHEHVQHYYSYHYYHHKHRHDNGDVNNSNSNSDDNKLVLDCHKHDYDLVFVEQHYHDAEHHKHAVEQHEHNAKQHEHKRLLFGNDLETRHDVSHHHVFVHDDLEADCHKHEHKYVDFDIDTETCHDVGHQLLFDYDLEDDVHKYKHEHVNFDFNI